MDVSQYLEIFIDETREHLQTLSEQLLILEKEPENADTINEIFRAAHSLKGMAGTMGYHVMQELTHKMEDVFSDVRNGKRKVDSNTVDLLFKGLDRLETILDCIVNAGNEGDDDCMDLITQLQAIIDGTASAAAAPAKKKGGKKAAAAAAAAAVAEEEAPAEDTKSQKTEKYKEFKYADFEAHAINNAIDEGMHAYGATVYIQETCLLKAARAFLVFKALEELGTVAKTEPSVQDIEDDKFEFEFSIVFLTKEDIDKVKAAIMSVSEIDSVAIGELDKDTVKKNSVKSEDSDESLIFTDSLCVNQIFKKLITNAVTFTNEGRIEIGAYLTHDEKNGNPQEIAFYVSDTGIGIAEDKINVIFERFRQGDEGATRQYGGNGLGLSIANELVNRMGGRITVKSQLNIGSTFTFYIPYETAGTKHNI